MMSAGVWVRLCGLCLFTAGCSSTRVTSSWTAPAASQVNLQRVLVVGLVPRESVRRNLETQLVRKLTEDKKTQATPSSSLVQEGALLTRERVKELVAQHGFDAVLVTQYLGTQVQVEAVPQTYADYFGYMQPLVYAQGATVEEERKVQLETRLFDARNGQMLWSAATSTVDTDDGGKAIPSVANKIADQLEKDVRI